MLEGAEGVGSGEEAAQGNLDLKPEAPPVESKDEALEGYDPKESASDTLTRVLKEQNEEIQPEATEKPAQPEKPAKQGKKQARDTTGYTENIQAPQRLTAEEKQLFNQLPPQLKPSVARMFADQERAFHQAQREWAESIKQNKAGDIIEAIKPFEDEWHEQGISRAAAIRALATAHRKLTSPDEKTFIDTYVKIGKERGVDFDKLAAHLKGQGGSPTSPQSFDINTHPDYVQLRQKVEYLESKDRDAQTSAYNSEVSQIGREFDALYNAQDQQGRYLYPELHDPAYQERVTPLVAALRSATPNLSYGEALRRAVLTTRGDPSQQTPTRPNANGQQTTTRAPIQAVSLRGRSAPPVLINGDLPDLPPEAARSAAETMRWVLANQRRG